jgi:hypothetical protein
VTHPTDWSWHVRAWRAGARWDRTRERVQDWLLSQPIDSDTLILLGGSAGWMMSPLFIERFRTLVLIDIDPWAGRLFSLRHRQALRARGTALTFLNGDAHELLDRTLQQYPQAYVLFDNFLGLDTLYTRDLKRTAERMQTLRQRLKGRVWGSVHDRFSGPGTPNWAHATCWRLQPEGQSGQALPQALYEAVQAHGQWLDHSTDLVFPQGTPVRLIPWPLIPGRWHWLEAAWVRS